MSSAEQNEPTEMDVDQPDNNQPGTSSTVPQDQDQATIKLEQVRRLQEARRAVDAYVNNVLYEMMCRSGIEIPREELEQGFEEFCRRNTSGLRIPDHLREWWNVDQQRQSGPSEE